VTANNIYFNPILSDLDLNYFQSNISLTLPTKDAHQVLETVGCPSVRLFVPSFDSSSGGFAAECGQKISIDSGGCRAPNSNGAAARRTAANAAVSCWQPI